MLHSKPAQGTKLNPSLGLKQGVGAGNRAEAGTKPKDDSADAAVKDEEIGPIAKKGNWHRMCLGIGEDQSYFFYIIYINQQISGTTGPEGSKAAHGDVCMQM
jgi:hypothetical protein